MSIPKTVFTLKGLEVLGATVEVPGPILWDDASTMTWDDTTNIEWNSTGDVTPEISRTFSRPKTVFNMKVDV